MTALNQARAWWLGRSDRERLMLGGLAVVLAALVAWYGVVTPLRRAADVMADRRARAEAGLALAKAALGPGGRRPAAAAGPLAATVDASAAAAGIAIERRREDADGRLTVWIASIEPQVLMQWLVTLRDGHGVTVAALSAAKTDRASLEVEIAFSRRS